MATTELTSEQRDALARRIAFGRSQLNAVLGAAGGIAGYAADSFDGTDGCVLFHEVLAAITALQDHPALKALANASIPPSLLTPTKKG